MNATRRTAAVVVVEDVTEALNLTLRIVRQSYRPSDVVGYNDATESNERIDATDADIAAALLPLDVAAAKVR